MSDSKIKSQMPTRVSVRQRFGEVKADAYWSFKDLKRTETSYITHGYHRYPAKFIPQVASELIQNYTKPGDLVVDPFGGCGTTVVESKVGGRRSVGVDINPVAVLIAKSKETAIEPRKLERAFAKLLGQIEDDLHEKQSDLNLPSHERIDYWFRQEEKAELGLIYNAIKKIRNMEIQRFMFCGFSNILKNCSIWMQKSNKPTRDFSKIPSEPHKAFTRQIRMMMRGNERYFLLLNERDNFDVASEIKCMDARETEIGANSTNLIVTSPPYVTSYEYADLHQLSALWFEYTDDLKDFRRKFIGTAHHGDYELDLNSSLAEETQTKLTAKHKKTAAEVATYFSEMNQVFCEMKRILKKGGRACIVIGNTSLKGVKILNAEVFTEQMLNLGFGIDRLIKRKIPSKILPSIRDKTNGRFVKATNKHKTLAYPTEYILVMRKR